MITIQLLALSINPPKNNCITSIPTLKTTKLVTNFHPLLNIIDLTKMLEHLFLIKLTQQLIYITTTNIQEASPQLVRPSNQADPPTITMMLLNSTLNIIHIHLSQFLTNQLLISMCMMRQQALSPMFQKRLINLNTTIIMMMIHRTTIYMKNPSHTLLFTPSTQKLEHTILRMNSLVNHCSSTISQVAAISYIKLHNPNTHSYLHMTQLLILSLNLKQVTS